MSRSWCEKNRWRGEEEEGFRHRNSTCKCAGVGGTERSLVRPGHRPREGGWPETRPGRVGSRGIFEAAGGQWEPPLVAFRPESSTLMCIFGSLP